MPKKHIKNIWLVNKYAMPPKYESRLRTIKFAHYLQLSGYNVTILGCSIMHNMNLNLIEDDSLYIERQYDDLHFVHVRSLPYRGSAGIKRILSEILFHYNLVKVMKKMPKADLIVATTDALISNPVLDFAHKNGIKYVKELLDMWPDVFVDLGLISAKNPIMKYLWHRAKKNYIESDAVVFSLTGCFDYIRAKGWDIESGGPVDMKKIYYIYVCLGVLLLTALPAKAASEAEFGKLAKTYTLHKDGSQEMRVYKELTLFTHAAMNGLYGESFIVYNPAYQELKIHESYTRQKDGKIVKTPENAFVEVLPAAAADAPAYNGLKEMVVVHTGLELGATICLDYSVITRPGYLPGLDVYVPVEELSPVKEYICSVSVPEDKPLNYALINGKAAPVVKNENGSKVVTWTLKNIPAYYPMESTPALSGNIPVILANTYPSMADALKVLKSQFTAAHEKEGMALAQKLLQGKNADEKEAVNALVELVKDNFGE